MGDSSDSDSDVMKLSTEDREAQTDPVDEITPLVIPSSAREPRSLEECITVFKSDVCVCCVLLSTWLFYTVLHILGFGLFTFISSLCLIMLLVHPVKYSYVCV